MFKFFGLLKKESVADDATPSWARGAVPAAPASPAAPAAPAMTEEEQWARMRAPQFAHERVLSGWTRNWLQALPEAVRPLELSTLHPHVVNRLALSWRDASLTEQLLADLLIGKRKGRRGFPPPVVAELLRMRDFHARGRAGPAPAGAATDGAQASASTAASTEPDWTRLRGPQRAIDGVLSGIARDWFEAIPSPLRPAELCSAYPRVANRLALCWNDPLLTERLLDDLLIGRRGKRKGFPKPIAEELLRLRRFHDHYRGLEAQDTVWEYRMLAVSDR